MVGSARDALSRAESLIGDLYGAHIGKLLLRRADSELAILILAEAQDESFALLYLVTETTTLANVVGK